MAQQDTDTAPAAHHRAHPTPQTDLKEALPTPAPLASTGTVDPLRLLEICETPLSLDEVHSAVGSEAAGGTTVFVGTVRDHDAGKGVTALRYSAHPTAERELRRVAEKVAANYPVLALAAVHRVGLLRVTDIAVIVAVSCAHRGEAFAACRRLIDDLKHEVPIWKEQTFTDGTDEWVGAC